MRQPLHKDAKNFVAGIVGYLHKGKRAGQAIPRLTTLLHRVTARAKTEGVAQIESAVALTSEEKRQLAQVLGRVLGRTVAFEYKIVPGLLGGLRITVGDWVVDTSWKEQLTQMTQAII